MFNCAGDLTARECLAWLQDLLRKDFEAMKGLGKDDDGRHAFLDLDNHC